MCPPLVRIGARAWLLQFRYVSIRLINDLSGLLRRFGLAEVLTVIAPICVNVCFCKCANASALTDRFLPRSTQLF